MSARLPASTSAGSTSVDSIPTNTSNVKPLQVKLVLLGEAAVGKSSLVLRFVNDEFQENKEPTIGAAFLAQKCRLEDKVIKFEIWDTAGQERFHSLAPMYYRNAQAAVVVYDVTKAVSLDKAKTWVKELQRQANPNIVIALAGNKVDLVTPNVNEDEEEQQAEDNTADHENATSAKNDIAASTYGRQVPTEEARAYAHEAGLLFFETSAKNGYGVVEVFTEIAKKIPTEHIMSAARSHTGAGGALNSGNGRIDLLREGGGVGGFGNFSDGRAAGNRSEGNCAC